VVFGSGQESCRLEKRLPLSGCAGEPLLAATGRAQYKAMILAHANISTENRASPALFPAALPPMARQPLCPH